MLDDLISQLTERTFALSLPHCELRQCGTPSPRTFTGSAFVRQETDGRLILRMFALEKLSERERLDRFWPDSMTPGVLIPDTEYYDMNATDQSGATWRAERQSITTIFGVGNEVRVELRRLERVEHLDHQGEFDAQKWFIPRNISLPWHLQTRTEQRMSVDRFEFEDEKFAWKARKSLGGLEVELAVKHASLEPHATRFLRSLGMLVGEILEPLVSVRTSAGDLITRFHRSPSLVPTRITGPMELIRYNQLGAHRFLTCCLNSAEQVYPEPIDRLQVIYRFWHRIAQAQRNDIENSSLVLSVAIEGVLKSLFHSEHDADFEFTQLVENERPNIAAVEVHERVRLSILRGVENATIPKPKDTLYRLKEQGVLTDTHITAWNQL